MKLMIPDKRLALSGIVRFPAEFFVETIPRPRHSPA
jgi:hypothetical protein